MRKRTLFGSAAGAFALCVVLVVAPGRAQAQGQDRRFIDRGLMVVDTQTNLMWEKKTTEVGSGQNVADLHDVDNTYVWSTAIGDWIGAVNAEGFAGFSDWRVPTEDELRTIVDTSIATCGSESRTPCIDPMFGPTQASYFSSTDGDFPFAARTVGFFSGNVFNGSKTGEFNVRAVRSSP